MITIQLQETQRQKKKKVARIKNIATKIKENKKLQEIQRKKKVRRITKKRYNEKDNKPAGI